MEMPISIMIVLFVSIAVAVLVLQLSGNIIEQGKTQIEQFKINCQEGIDFFVEAHTVTAQTIANLAKLCYNENNDKYESKICYVVHGEPDGDITASVDPEYAGEMDVAGAGKTVYIKFNARTHKVDISG